MTKSLYYNTNDQIIAVYVYTAVYVIFDLYYISCTYVKTNELCDSW